MKVEQNKTLGIVVNVNVPANAEEFDQMAGRPGACVDDANRNVIYRSWNHDFRKELCATLEKETGEERHSETTGEGDKAKKVYTEKEQAYVNRLIGENHIDEEKLQLTANAVAKDIIFDPAPSERSKKVPQNIQNAANSILAAVEAGESTAETSMEKFQNALGIEDFATSFGEFGEASVIKALLAHARKLEAEAAAQRNAFV